MVTNFNGNQIFKKYFLEVGVQREQGKGGGRERQ